MRADAARYRWLRDQALVAEFGTHAPAVFMCDDDGKAHGNPIDGEQLDRQIDLRLSSECHPKEC